MKWFFVRQVGKKYAIYRRINLYGGDDPSNIIFQYDYDLKDEAEDNCQTYNVRMH